MDNLQFEAENSPALQTKMSQLYLDRLWSPMNQFFVKITDL